LLGVVFVPASRRRYEGPPRQGPTLFNIVGRRAGTDGYHYSPNFASADFVWDDHTLDAWLVNPQAVIAGATMASAGEACRSCGYHLVSQGTALNGQTCPLHDPRFR